MVSRLTPFVAPRSCGHGRGGVWMKRSWGFIAMAAIYLHTKCNIWCLFHNIEPLLTTWGLIRASSPFTKSYAPLIHICHICSSWKMITIEINCVIFTSWRWWYWHWGDKMACWWWLRKWHTQLLSWSDDCVFRTDDDAMRKLFIICNEKIKKRIKIKYKYPLAVTRAEEVLCNIVNFYRCPSQINNVFMEIEMSG